MRLGGPDSLGPEGRRRWAAARVWSAHQAPYLASALLALDPVVVDQSDDPPGRRHDLAALPVDRSWHVYLDPEVVSATQVAELGFWLIHQVGHLLRHHAARSPAEEEEGGTRVAWGGPLAGRSRAELAWNLAADAEIDDDLVAGDVVIPPTAVTPHTLGQPDGLTAEQYWDAIRPDVAPAPDAPPGGAGWAEGPAADCGSGCDGCRRPWDAGWPGLGEAGERLVGRDVARRILEHHRRRGNVPAGWQRWAHDVLEPTVDWRRQLAATIRRGMADIAGRVDFTYRRPSRRASISPDVVLPSLRQPLPKVAMVLDTSGSMSDTMLAQCLGEVGGVLRSLGVGRRALRIVCCDAQAYEAQRALDPGHVQLLGGGGTDMGAGLAYAAALTPRPDLVIVLTDGFTPWPPRPPRGVRVVVGLLDGAGAVPPWATSVLVGGDGRGGR